MVGPGPVRGRGRGEGAGAGEADGVGTAFWDGTVSTEDGGMLDVGGPIMGEGVGMTLGWAEG